MDHVLGQWNGLSGGSGVSSILNCLGERAFSLRFWPFSRGPPGIGSVYSSSHDIFLLARELHHQMALACNLHLVADCG